MLCCSIMRTTVSGFENPLNSGCQEARLTARTSDRSGNHGAIIGNVSKRTACRIKSLFGEKEKSPDIESKDRARNS